MDDIDPGDDYDEAPNDHEAEIEEAREEGFEAGKEEGQARSFGCGCLFGVVLTLTAIYLGWCSPHTG